MILEEDDATKLYKARSVAYLKTSINKIFLVMTPVFLGVVWLICRYEDQGPSIWPIGILPFAGLYLGLQYMIYAIPSKNRWAVERGRIKRKGEFSCRLNAKTVVSSKLIPDFKGYYELNVGLLRIILNESRFPRNEIVSFVEKEAHMDRMTGEQGTACKDDSRVGDL